MTVDERRLRRQRFAAWAVTWLAYATYYTGRKGFSVVKKTLEHDLGVTRGFLGVIDTGFLSAYALGQFVNGVLADGIGARRLVGYGMLLSAAACAGFGASKSVTALFILFALNGYFQSTGWPGTTRAMAEWTTPENRGTVMGFWATCYQVGGIVATALAAWLLGHAGWRSAFFVPALLMAGVGALVFLLLRPGPRPVILDESARVDDAAKLRAARAKVLKSKLLWCYGASYFCIKLIRYSLLFWLPYYLSDRLGYKADEAGYLSSAFEVGGVLGVIAIGVASDRFRRLSRSMLAAFVLVALGFALVFYARAGGEGWLINATGLAFVGACLFGPDSLISGAAAQDAGGHYAAATATGFVNGLGSVGAVLQGIVTVRISEAFGWQALMYVFVALSLVAALALVPTVRTG